jgi:RNA polymerase sigma-70 factor, ECF subfamily
VSLEDDLTRLRKGDLDALATLIEQYQARLYRYLLRLVREPATAEDIFQQTWLRVAERIKSYDARRKFENWLFTVARNLAYDHLRRYQPESLDEPLPSGDSRLELLPGSEHGAFESLLAEERGALVARAMEGLPLIYREVLALRFEHDLKLEEIAGLLRIPLSTVKSRLRRALEDMRHLLSKESGLGTEHERAH